MTEGNETMSIAFGRKMTVKQGIYNEMREEKQKDIKHGKSQKVV